jgi:hypothetical protein
MSPLPGCLRWFRRWLAGRLLWLAEAEAEAEAEGDVAVRCGRMVRAWCDLLFFSG